MKILLSLIVYFAFLLSNFTFGQSNEKYDALIKQADSFYKEKDYSTSSQKYKEAFKIKEAAKTINDIYNAVCTWSLNGEIEIAINQLESLAIDLKLSNYDHVIQDTDLKNLHQHKKWNDILNVIKQNKEKEEAKLNKPVKALLDTIYNDDQTLRIQLEDTVKKYGEGSPEVKKIWKIINELDSLNLIKVSSILDKYGWLGAEEVGYMGNITIFLVIQHADLETQIKYLPMMRDAVKNGKANGSDLALLEDRVAIRQGNEQIYGSQIGVDYATNSYYILPLTDPDNVDKRRASVGLNSISEYVKQWDIVWDIEQYKKDLPKLKEK